MKFLPVVLCASLLLLAGCGKSEDSVAKSVGKKVAGAAVDFGSGIGQGVDEKLLTKVDVGPEATKAGLTVTTAKGLGPNPKGINVYLLSKAATKATLVAKALNKEGAEIGRSLVEIDFAADDAKYVAFAFDKELDTQLVAKYLIEIRP